MENIQYPLTLQFKIGTLANDFVIRDKNETIIAYVRQKMFKFIDEIQVFNNESQTESHYTIKANKWIDFSASYIFSDQNGREIGRVARKGWASIWKARYQIFDATSELTYQIQEENGWTKVFDAILGEIPILGFFTGYLFNPAYKVMQLDGSTIVRLKKEASFLGRQFSVTKIAEFESNEDERIVLSLMMMIVLERRRG